MKTLASRSGIRVRRSRYVYTEIPVYTHTRTQRLQGYFKYVCLLCLISGVQRAYQRTCEQLREQSNLISDSKDCFKDESQLSFTYSRVRRGLQSISHAHAQRDHFREICKEIRKEIFNHFSSVVVNRKSSIYPVFDMYSLFHIFDFN